MEDIGTGEHAGNNFFEDSPLFDGEAKRNERAREGTPANLTLYRWDDQILDPDEERALIRSAQSGDMRAKNLLATRFHRKVLKEAAEFYGPSRDDLIAAGMLGLAEAVARYDLRRNTRLSAYAIPMIRFSISEAAKAWRRRDQAGEKRADRFVYNNRLATPEQVAKKVGCSLRDAEAAIRLADAYWHGHERYETSERGFDNESENARAVVVAIDVPPVEVHATGHIVTAEDWAATVVYRQRDELKAITRKRYEADQFAAHTAGAAQARLHQLLSKHVGYHTDKPIRSAAEKAIMFRYGLQRLGDEIDRLALRRLRRIGRRAYALELVARDHARIDARATDNYLYPEFRSTAKKAEVLPIKSAPRKRRPSRIRSWRSEPSYIAAGAA